MTSEAPPGRAPFLPEDMGEKRTIMAADRTLMAWIRTSLSMSSFGFTIYKFMDGLADQGGIARSDSPRHIGMFLVTLGIVSILLGTIGYWMTLRDLQRAEMFRLARPVLVMALIMSVAGVVLLVGIATRLV
jgi:putative membrane protein